MRVSETRVLEFLAARGQAGATLAQLVAALPWEAEYVDRVVWDLVCEAKVSACGGDPWVFRLAVRGGRCRACGCTDLDCLGCMQRTGLPCYWEEPDLCSACAREESGVGQG